jgi:hypothetical protein
MEIKVEIEVERDDRFITVIAILEGDRFIPGIYNREVDDCYEDDGGTVDIVSLYVSRDGETELEEVDEDFLESDDVKEIMRLGLVQLEELDEDESMSEDLLAYS